MKLALSDVGEGGAVVLLHGFPFDRSIWKDQVEAIGKVYRMITPDLRGHGETASTPGVYDVDGMADDVLETLDSLGLRDKVVLGGLSMGGYVALSIAVRFPERLRGLLLINTRSAGDPPATAKVREELAQQVEASGKVDQVVDGMIQKLFSMRTVENNPGLIAERHVQMAATSAQGVIGTLRGLAIRPDRTPALPDIRVPTLVIAGEDDQLIPIGESEQMAAAIPGAELVVIPDAGHLAPLENPGRTNLAILEALDRWS